jgi:hypothetical protein
VEIAPNRAKSKSKSKSKSPIAELGELKSNFGAAAGRVHRRR